MRVLLGSFVEAGAHGAQAAAALQAAFAAIERAQALWSFHERDSELSRLNAAPGRAVPVSPSTLRLLHACRAMMRRSSGLFDITVGGTLVASGALPDHGGAAALARGSVDDILLGAGTASLRRPVRLTLDGVAKGFAIDLALSAMRRAGAPAGWVNAGGDVGVFGELTLPMQRREDDGSLRPLGGLRNGAMASSRCGPRDADFPAEIVAPGTSPPEAGLWTVLARSAWRADALAKVAAVAAPAQRLDLVRQLGGTLVAMEEFVQ